jgi:hypothetical protein
MSAELRVCPSCFGTGWTKAPIGAEPLLEQCGKCGGIGQVPAAPASPANTAEATGEREAWEKEDRDNAIYLLWEREKEGDGFRDRVEELVSHDYFKAGFLAARARPALTDEQIDRIADQFQTREEDPEDFRQIARAIERHLNGEKP